MKRYRGKDKVLLTEESIKRRIKIYKSAHARDADNLLVALYTGVAEVDMDCSLFDNSKYLIKFRTPKGVVIFEVASGRELMKYEN